MIRHHRILSDEKGDDKPDSKDSLKTPRPRLIRSMGLAVLEVRAAAARRLILLEAVVEEWVRRWRR